MLRITVTAVSIACLTLIPSTYAASEESFLFVQEASSATFDGTTLTLTDPKPTVTAFADRPNRLVEDIELSRFVSGWSQGMESFQDDPPNAALIADGAAPVIVELQRLRTSAGGLQYDAKVLSGSMPSKMNGVTLVIDDNESMCGYIGC